MSVKGAEHILIELCKTDEFAKGLDNELEQKMVVVFEPSILTSRDRAVTRLDFEVIAKEASAEVSRAACDGRMGADGEVGVVILPPNPGFYHGVTEVSELVDFIVARILDQLGVENALSPRWGH